MPSLYYGYDEYEGDYLAREQYEDFFAQSDYLSEAYGATARDAARCAEEDYEADADDHNAHVIDYYIDGASRFVGPPAPAYIDDIPF